MAFPKDMDTHERLENEWAEIYGVELLDMDVSIGLMDEFEWCWRMLNVLSTVPVIGADGETTLAEEMETRARVIYQEIYASATPAERHMLRNQRTYVETKAVLQHKTGRAGQS